MKIAIFGDSWAKQLKEADELNSTPAWWEILAKKYEVENFGLSGSSTYYSYNNFQRLHSTFDKIIFIPLSEGEYCLNHTRLDEPYKSYKYWYETSLENFPFFLNFKNLILNLLKNNNSNSKYIYYYSNT